MPCGMRSMLLLGHAVNFAATSGEPRSLITTSREESAQLLQHAALLRVGLSAARYAAS